MMRTRHAGLAIAVVLAGASLAGPVSARQPAGSPDAATTTRLVAGFEPGRPGTRSAIEATAHGQGGAVLRVDDTLSFAVVGAPAERERALLGRLAALDGVRYAEPDPVVVAHYVPNDPRYPDQWGPPVIGMVGAWDTTRGTHAITAAVIDTGVDATHEDLAANICGGGHDFVNDDDDPADDNGHGTHVAGTVAAAIGNATGVAGMTNACIMAIKVLGADGSGFASDVASGMAWAADHGARVINMSLGGPHSAAEASAAAYAWAQGVLIVASAGNSGCASVGFPAAYREVIAVGSLDSSGPSGPGTRRSTFSDCGDEVELAAPGSSILSTCTGDRYCRLSGTSMASPHVAGVAALAWSPDLARTNADVRCVLRQTADDLGPPGRDEEYGVGRVDAAGAISALSLQGPQPGCSALWPPSPPAPCGFPCQENFDDATADHMTLSSLWHVSGACAAAPSAPGYLGYNLDADCTYDTGTGNVGSAVLWVDLAGVERASLSFAHRRQTELVPFWDRMHLLVSTGQNNWGLVATYQETDLVDLGWQQERVDLTPFTGRVVGIRWRFVADSPSSNDHLGWLIDDVEVAEPGLIPLP